MNEVPGIGDPCDKCGLAVEWRRGESVQGPFCNQCGWLAVTTYIPPLYLDDTVYEVRACGGDYKNKSHIKTVAELSGRNFLEARKLLEQDAPVVFKGEARAVCRVRDALVAAGLGYRIEPPFPHADAE